jgi:hypothetical protein
MHSVDMETRYGPGSYLRTLENRIRERAHEIWTAHGCIHGQADQHWHAAEREILTESTATLAGVQQKRRFRAGSKKSDWRRELRIKFFGMVFWRGHRCAGRRRVQPGCSSQRECAGIAGTDPRDRCARFCPARRGRGDGEQTGRGDECRYGSRQHGE